ncbi:MAG: hopene-associated glycosyltransferase HpnB, partial [Gammaproteobacteria bacterium]
VLCLPWRPWSTREFLEAIAEDCQKSDLSQITVLIPARNEAEVIAKTLAALKLQDESIKIILIDDQSDDDTSNIAKDAASQAGLNNLKIITGQPLPDGWSGKLWALEQGRKHVDTDTILLLDADITLAPGTIASLLQKLNSEQLDLVSLMAFLRMKSFWEIFLMPAFIYFFKLLYPFQLSNASSDRLLSKYVAAAAGGCILVRRGMLEKIGGFNTLKDALIDDCTLARKIKANGGKTWVGLTHSALSHRQYNSLQTIWDMVARTAYTQLRYSPILLLLCTLAMLIVFVFPLVSLFLPDLTSKLIGLLTILIMAVTYLPILKFYDRHPAWSITLPVIGILYLLMTWTSALRHISGSGSSWKQRQYTS